MRRTVIATCLLMVMLRPLYSQESQVADSGQSRSTYQTEKLLEDVTQDASDSQLADIREKNTKKWVSHKDAWK